MARIPTAAGELPDEGYFDVMADNAPTHWWYEARRALIGELLAHRVPVGSVAVDVGCGTGEVMAVLAEAGARTVVGTDLSPRALGYASSGRGRGSLVASRAERLPFPAACVDVLVSLEVIEHLDSDLAALVEYRRVLRPGGTLLVTVPAYESLWSDHDEWAGHRRRYGAGQLRRTVERAGFDVDRTSYYFSFLVPPAFAVRRTPLRRLISSTDEAASSSPLVSRVMAGAARAERSILRRVDRLPFGLSILALATAR
jgi:ubiquinone/menaquinone biosynthesis C-methylase UbiE